MPFWGNNSLAIVFRPFGRAMLFMAGTDERFRAAPPEEFRPVWAALLALSIACGAAMTTLWGVAGGLFGGAWYTPWFVSSAAVLAFMVLGPFRRAILQAGQLLGRGDPSAAALSTCLLVAVLAMLLLALKTFPLYNELPLPPALAWVRPEFDGARALVLMPIWGCWGMLVLTQLYRPGPNTEPALTAMAKGCGPIAASLSVLLPVLGTWFYFQFLGPWQHLAISGFAAGAAILAGLALAALDGGLTRQAVLATNLLVQIAFILGYLFAHVHWTK